MPVLSPPLRGLLRLRALSLRGEEWSSVDSSSLFSLPCRSAVFCCLVCTQDFAWQSVGSLFRVGSQGSGGRERILEEKMTLSIASTKAIEYIQLAVYRIVDKYG